MFWVQPQRNNDRRETSESAGQNKSQRQTIEVDGARYRLAADSHPRDTAATDRARRATRHVRHKMLG